MGRSRSYLRVGEIPSMGHDNVCTTMKGYMLGMMHNIIFDIIMKYMELKLKGGTEIGRSISRVFWIQEVS